MLDNDQHLTLPAGDVGPEAAGALLGWCVAELDHDPGKGKQGMHWVSRQEPEKLLSAQPGFQRAAVQAL